MKPNSTLFSVVEFTTFFLMGSLPALFLHFLFPDTLLSLGDNIVLNSMLCAVLLVIGFLHFRLPRIIASRSKGIAALTGLLICSAVVTLLGIPGGMQNRTAFFCLAGYVIGALIAKAGYNMAKTSPVGHQIE